MSLKSKLLKEYDLVKLNEDWFKNANNWTILTNKEKEELLIKQFPKLKHKARSLSKKGYAELPMEIKNKIDVVILREWDLGTEYTVTGQDGQKLFNESNELLGGLSDNMSLEDIAKKHNTTLLEVQEQLQKGMEVEMEHTDDSNIAIEIAKDHLVEDLYYYDKLETIEQD